MSTKLEVVLELSRKASLVARELALGIPKATEGRSDDLHEKALNLLLFNSQIETALQSLQEREKNSSKFLSKKNNELSFEEVEVFEVAKLYRRVPRWARNPRQINSQILTCYLLLSAETSRTVTEGSLRQKFILLGGNEDQFNKNFPQMKMISERNHGKVFDVINGKVTIWEPAKLAVDEFRTICQRKD